MSKPVIYSDDTIHALIARLQDTAKEKREAAEAILDTLEAVGRAKPKDPDVIAIDLILDAQLLSAAAGGIASLFAAVKKD